jgi:hypothetical protein
MRSDENRTHEGKCHQPDREDKHERIIRGTHIGPPERDEIRSGEERGRYRHACPRKPSPRRGHARTGPSPIGHDLHRITPHRRHQSRP